MLRIIACCVVLFAFALLLLHAAGAQDNVPVRPTRSVVRARQGMVASSQPLASQAGLEVLKRGGNAVDAALAMAAVLNVTEPMSTGIGGDAFVLVYWSKTGELKGLNASGRAPRALTLEHFQKKGLKEVPEQGVEPITVPGAVDGWFTLHAKYGTRPMAELLAPAIEYAENGFAVMEKVASDWASAAEHLQNDVARAQYLPGGRAPRPGEIFRNPTLARTFRMLAKDGRDAFYQGEIAKEMVAYLQANGGFLSAEDLAQHHSDWVEPISTDYRGYQVYEIPPNGQGITALIALNIMEGFELSQMNADQYEHTLIEAMKLAFADRARYIADPQFAKVPVKELLSKEYAAKRRALISADKAIADPQPGVLPASGDTTYFSVVDKDRNAVSFIYSLYDLFGSGMVAGNTGVVLQNRGAGFSLDPEHPNRLEPGKRPFHTIIPAMVMKDGKLWLSYGVMGGAVQPQGHVQVLSNLIDRGMNLQQAIEAPRFRYAGGNRVWMEGGLGDEVIGKLLARGHVRPERPAPASHGLRRLMGGGQAVMIDHATDTLLGASDPRKDGLALGY